MSNIPRWNEDILGTSCRCDVEEFQEGVKVAQNTVLELQRTALRSTDDPDDDAQQGPDVVDARPRADSSSAARCSECRPRADRSAVARLYVANLEPASLREREREKLQGQAAKETVPDVLEAREW